MDSIIIKIRKLLAVANDKGASEHEAETAALMATQLMEKYNISRKEVDIEVSDIGQTQIWAYIKRVEGQKWEWALLQTLAKHNFCKVVGNNNSRGILLTLMGEEDNRKMVEETFYMLRWKFRDLLKIRYADYKKGIRSVLMKKLTPEFIDRHWAEIVKEGLVSSESVWTRSYLSGCVAGLAKRLHDENKPEDTQEYGLVLKKHESAIEKYIENQIGEVREKKSRKEIIDEEAYIKGVIDGKQKDNKQLNGG